MQALFVKARAMALIATPTRNEKPSPLVCHAELAKLGFTKRRGAPRTHNRLRPAHPNARHAQKFLVRRSVHLDGKPIEVVDSPVRLRIDVGGKKRLALIDEPAASNL